MSPRSILQWPDKRLRTAAEPVTEITDDIRAIWTDMIDTMEAMPGVGLAAPQIGVMLRLAVVDASEERGKAVRLANPEIVDASPRMRSHDEASPCLPGVSARLERPEGVLALSQQPGSDGSAYVCRSGGDLGPASDRPSERADVFRQPVGGETADVVEKS